MDCHLFPYKGTVIVGEFLFKPVAVSQIDWKFGCPGQKYNVHVDVNTIFTRVMYNAHFFLTNFASKIEMHIIHGTFAFT